MLKSNHMGVMWQLLSHIGILMLLRLKQVTLLRLAAHIKYEQCGTVVTLQTCTRISAISIMCFVALLRFPAYAG